MVLYEHSSFDQQWPQRVFSIGDYYLFYTSLDFAFNVQADIRYVSLNEGNLAMDHLSL